MLYYLYHDNQGIEHCRTMFDLSSSCRPGEAIEACAERHLKKLFDLLQTDKSALGEWGILCRNRLTVTDQKNVYEVNVPSDSLPQSMPAMNVYPVVRSLDFLEHYDYAMLQRKAAEESTDFSRTSIEVGYSMWIYSDCYVSDDSKIGQSVRWDSFLKTSELHLKNAYGDILGGVEISLSPTQIANDPVIDSTNPYIVTRDGEMHIISSESMMGSHIIRAAQQFCNENKDRLISEFLKEKTDFEKRLPPKTIPNPHAVYEFINSDGIRERKVLADLSRAENGMCPEDLIKALLLKEMSERIPWGEFCDERDPYRQDKMLEYLKLKVAITDGEKVYTAKTNPVLQGTNPKDLMLCPLAAIESPMEIQTVPVNKVIPLKRSIPFSCDWDIALRSGDFLEVTSKQTVALHR